MSHRILPAARKLLSTRRLLVFGSVLGIGAAVMLAGPGGYRVVEFNGAPAHAVEAVQPQAGFADLIAKVKPAVIAVRVKIEENAKTTGSGSSNEIPPFAKNSPFEKFFRQFGMPDFPNAPNFPHGRQIITGEGSGFFISADGYAVTNYHVVDHAKTVQVKTDDGKTYTAKVVGTDQKTDLALIKVDADKRFSFVTFAGTTPRVGDWVIAVGNPYGLAGTATAGIVSARGRDIGAGPYDDFIQIDAPINKGNSGGPAFNIDGKVIGVNTAIYSPSGGSIGIGFAIPADTVQSVVAQLKARGYVERGWIGVKVQAVTPDIADSLGMKKAEGALVADTETGQPAAKAGVKSGDVITAINGSAVKDSRELARKIGAMAPGSTVKLSIRRKGEDKTLTVTLAKMPKEQQAKAETGSQDESGTSVPHLGLTIAPAKDVAGAGSKGVVVTSVDPDSAAADHGVQSGDVILEVGGKPASSTSAVKQAVAAARSKGKHAVLMRVKSGDNTRFIALPIGHA